VSRCCLAFEPSKYFNTKLEDCKIFRKRGGGGDDRQELKNEFMAPVLVISTL